MSDYGPDMDDYVGEYLIHLRTSNRAPSTVDTYADILRRLDRQLPHGLARAHADELREFIWTGTRSPATLKSYRAAVAGFFRWATDDTDEQLLDYNPTRHLPTVRVPRRAPRPVTTGQLRQIMRRATQPYLTWYILAAYAGLRCVEIAALDREHVTEETLWVHGKGAHERTVPTHPDVWAAISPLPPGPIAVAADGARATRRQIKDRGNRHLHLRVGLPVTMHRLRHWYGTHVYRAQGEFVAQRLLGHASPSTTAIYAQVASESMAAAVAALPRVT